MSPKTLVPIVMALLVIAGAGVGLILYPSIYPEQAIVTNDAKNCLADDCLLVDDLEYPVGELSQEIQEALKEAIYDEYKARDTYEQVIAKFGSVRPFSMIIRSEEQHIASLKAVYDKYGIVAPQDPWTGLEVPATLTESCQLGVDAEIANVALYRDSLLPLVKDYADITQVFNTLMDASESKHLPAFTKCAK